MAKKRDEAGWLALEARRDTRIALMSETARRQFLQAALHRRNTQLLRWNSPDEFLRQALEALDEDFAGVRTDEEIAVLLATTRAQCLDDLRVARKTPREWRAGYQACVSLAAAVATDVSPSVEDVRMAAEELVFATGIAEERDVDHSRSSEMWSELTKQAMSAESLTSEPSIMTWRKECHWLTFAKKPVISQTPVVVDAHLEHIRTVERARDPEAAAAMEQALILARGSAEAGEKLTYELLARWQAVALPDLTIAPDSGSAFADMSPDRRKPVKKPEQHFDAALASRLDRKEPLVWRAVGLCLDIVCFRPFKDGNRRAARLAVDYLLTREGFALRSVRPLFTNKLTWDHSHLMEQMESAVGPRDEPRPDRRRGA